MAPSPQPKMWIKVWILRHRRKSPPQRGEEYENNLEADFGAKAFSTTGIKCKIYPIPDIHFMGQI